MYEKSLPVDSQWAPRPSPNGVGDNSNPNNPFRNPNALGAAPPPPYESNPGSSPFAGNSSGSNNPTYSNQGSAQRSAPFPPGGNSYQEQQAYSYQAPQGPPPQHPFASSSPPSLNQYGGGYNSEYPPQSLDRDGPSFYGGEKQGTSSGNIQPSYFPQQQQYPQQSQQRPTQWTNNPQYQSSPGQYQSSPNQSSPGQPASSGSSRGFFDSQHFDPNQPSANRSGGGSGGLLGMLGGKNPLDPPPPQFNRPPPGNYPYMMFPPMACLSMSNKLDDGWPMLPPPAPMGGQHPFLSHDVTEEDWTKFLRDIKVASSLSGKDRIVSNALPMVMGMSLMGGLLASHVIEGRMKGKKVGPLGDFIDAWNNYFFNPRKMNVVLAQDQNRFSGRIDAPPPDMTGSGFGGYSRSYSDSDSDSDHSSHSAYDNRHRRGESYGQQGGFLAAGGGGRHNRSSSQGRLPTRKEARREAKRERKAERRGHRRGGGSQNSSGSGYSSGRVDRHGNSLEKWRLVVCFWDGSREVV